MVINIKLKRNYISKLLALNKEKLQIARIRLLLPLIYMASIVL